MPDSSRKLRPTSMGLRLHHLLQPEHSHIATRPEPSSPLRSALDSWCARLLARSSRREPRATQSAPRRWSIRPATRRGRPGPPHRRGPRRQSSTAVAGDRPPNASPRSSSSTRRSPTAAVLTVEPSWTAIDAPRSIPPRCRQGERQDDQPPGDAIGAPCEEQPDAGATEDDRNGTANQPTTYREHGFTFAAPKPRGHRAKAPTSHGLGSKGANYSCDPTKRAAGRSAG
jgi:hypothetical protein